MPIRGRADIPVDAVRALCRQYHVTELALFGSGARGQLGPDSDVDMLVTFDPACEVGYSEFMDLQEALAHLLGRKVDLVPKETLKRVLRRRVLAEAQPIYAE